MPNVTDKQWKIRQYYRGGGWDEKDWITLTAIGGGFPTYAQYSAAARQEYLLSEADYNALLASVKPVASQGGVLFGQIRTASYHVQIIDTTDNLFFEGAV